MQAIWDRAQEEPEPEIPAVPEPRESNWHLPVDMAALSNSFFGPDPRYDQMDTADYIRLRLAERLKDFEEATAKRKKERELKEAHAREARAIRNIPLDSFWSGVFERNPMALAYYVPHLPEEYHEPGSIPWLDKDGNFCDWPAIWRIMSFDLHKGHQ